MYGSSLAVLLAATTVNADLGAPRRHAHHGHGGIVHSDLVEKVSVEKRGGQCAFPENEGLVAVTPNESNAGWAMSPDQPCTPGSWCPYACPPGQLSGQWDPEATSYTYPQSQYGGLYCDSDGNMQKPFPNKPYCYDGTGTVVAKNQCGSQVAFCQTVLPGNEAMLIPTNVGSGSLETLAVPDENYWAGTAAHYYINPPGVSTETACVWGTNENPWGNWSPYVAGANADSSGNTYTKIGWNPIYLEPTTPFRDEKPTFGVRIVCDGNCVGLPCEIDPSQQGVNEVNSGESSVGAGGAAFCVVTAQSGSKAHIEVFEVGSGSGSGSSSSSDSSDSSSSSSADSTTSSSDASSYDTSSSEVGASSDNVQSSPAPEPTTSSSTPPPPPSTTSTSTTPTTTETPTTSSTSSTPPPPPSTTSTTVPSTSSAAPSSSLGVESVSQLASRSALNLMARLSSSSAPESSSAAPTSSSEAPSSSSEPLTHAVTFVSDLFATSREALFNVATSASINSTSKETSTRSSATMLAASTTGDDSSSSAASTAAASSTHKKNGASIIGVSATLPLLMALAHLL